MKGQLLSVLLVAFAATALGMVFNCADPKSCDKCPPMPENCQKVEKCGCCDICKDTLKEGESCVMSIVMTTLSQKQCGSGLMCDQDTMKCASKPVVMAKLFPGEQNQVIYQHRPQESVGCNDTVCFCAHEGRQLQQYKPLRKTHLTQHSCNCAHAKETYRKTRLIGKMFFCNGDGSYKNVQCLGSSCFCVNQEGIRVLSDSFHISEYEDNKC